MHILEAAFLTVCAGVWLIQNDKTTCNIQVFKLGILLSAFRHALGATTSLRFRRDVETFFASLHTGKPPSTSSKSQHETAVCDVECLGKPAKLMPQRAKGLPPLSPLTVLELGIHEGYTTAALSTIFHRVIAVDFDPVWLHKARLKQEQMGGSPNVMFLRMDLYSDNWGMLRENRIEVVFVDAAHDYLSVKSDVINSLQLNGVEWLIFHDYGQFNNETDQLKGLPFRQPHLLCAAADLLAAWPGAAQVRRPYCAKSSVPGSGVRLVHLWPRVAAMVMGIL